MANDQSDGDGDLVGDVCDNCPTDPNGDQIDSGHTTSNFTVLTGASHPEELVQQAAALGYRALALTDCNTLAGIVRVAVEIGRWRVQFRRRQ